MLHALSRTALLLWSRTVTPSESVADGRNCTLLQENNRPGLVLHRRADASKRYPKTNLSLCLEQKNLLPLLEIEPLFIGRPVQMRVFESMSDSAFQWGKIFCYALWQLTGEEKRFVPVAPPPPPPPRARSNPQLLCCCTPADSAPRTQEGDRNIMHLHCAFSL